MPTTQIFNTGLKDLADLSLQRSRGEINNEQFIAGMNDINAKSISEQNTGVETSIPSGASGNEIIAYGDLLNAIKSLDYSALQKSVLNYSSPIMTMFNLVCSRKFLWNVVYQDPDTMKQVQQVQAAEQLGVGVVGGVTAALMAAGALTAGLTTLIGALTQGAAFLSQGMIASDTAQRAEDLLGSYVDNQKYVYHDTLATNIYNSVVEDSWHDLNKTEGEGALIHLKPKMSTNPVANTQYSFAVTNLWIEAAKNVRDFYQSFNFAAYQNAITASKQAQSQFTGNLTTYIIIGVLLVLAILFFAH